MDSNNETEVAVFGGGPALQRAYANCATALAYADLPAQAGMPVEWRGKNW